MIGSFLKKEFESKRKKKKISAERAVLTSLFVNFLDVITNAIVAFITGSIVIVAGTVQGVADSLSVGFVYIGLKRSKKPADKKHPFGYGKSLYFWTFAAGMIMFGITSVAVFYFGLQRFLNPEEIKHIYLAIAVLILFIVSNGYSLSVGARRILDGKKPKEFLKIFKKSEMVETKTTFTLDLIGTSAAIIGLVALILYQFTGDIRFDGLGAMAIGVTLAGLTLFLLNNTRKLLVGKRASPATEKKIKKAILEVKDVKSVLDFKTMNIGLGKILVNAEVSVNEELTTKHIEKLMDKIKENVQEKVKEVFHIQIEIETPDSDVRIRAEK